jgi:hypothetical protein
MRVCWVPAAPNVAARRSYPEQGAPCLTPQVFQRHAVGVGSEVATVFGVDGAATALRADLGAMLNQLLGRQARKAELQVGGRCACVCSQTLVLLAVGGQGGRRQARALSRTMQSRVEG